MDQKCKPKAYNNFTDESSISNSYVKNTTANTENKCDTLMCLNSLTIVIV